MSIMRGKTYQVILFCLNQAERLKRSSFDKGGNCFDNISIKRNVSMNPQQELQITLLIEGFFKYFLFDLMSLFTCADAIHIDHLPCWDMHFKCLRRTCDVTKMNQR